MRPARAAALIAGAGVTALATMLAGSEPRTGVAGADSAAAVAWTRTHAIRVRGAEPGGGIADLEPLRAVVGDARIVALGEGTHGTREYFQMKHRITEFLGTSMGFTLFAIEANMPEAYRVNDYVLTGRGDPKALLRGMYFWTWNTEEVLAMIEWMRAFNRSGKGRMQFLGFDMQTPDTAMAIVERFVARAAPDLADSARHAFDVVRRARGRSGIGTAYGEIPAAACAGGRVRFHGWVRTADVADGYAGLWLDVQADSGRARGDNMEKRGLSGTRDWTHCEIVLEVPVRPRSIRYGALLTGTGEAWFDSLVVEIDGVPFAGAGVPDLDMRRPGDPLPLRGSGFSYTYAIDSDDRRSGRSVKIASHRVSGGNVPSLAEAARAASDFERSMRDRRETWIRKFPPAEVDWAIQNARIVVQGAASKAQTGSRDRSMADNVAWILEQAPKEKIVLWAHNGHVTRRFPQMGSFLGERFGRDMVVFGFAMHEGTYTALGADGLATRTARPSPAGSVESVLYASGIPGMVLDLRRLPAGSAAARWFEAERPFRSIGAMVDTNGFWPAAVTRDYDALVYFDRTTHSRLVVR